MAGISFELRKVLRERTLGSIVKAYGYSAVLSAGPYLISILTLIISFYVLRPIVSSDKIVIQFGVIVTYLTAFSLILTGFSQLMITRFLADRIFEKKYEVVLPNLIGNMLLNMILAFIISLIFSVIFFKEQGTVFIILYVLIFTIMCGLWIVNVVLTGFKSYKFIVFSFATAYITFFLLALYMARYDLAGLMFSFFIGQAVLFFLLLGYFIKTHYSDKIISFDFLDRHKIYISLIFSGFFYNLGIWIDKFIFWFYPDTSIQILGPVRASIVYDIPMFLAYIAIAPGMAVFFLKLETEFADYYDRYYHSVREGATLNKIYQLGDDMILSARSVIFDTLRIQGIAFVFFLIFDTLLFKIFKLSLLYIPLFHVLMVGTYLQLIFMTLLSILNYFDRRREVLYLSILFAVSNAVFTYASILLGPYFYGYGYVLSLFISDLLAIILLRRFLDEIHYQTFMLI
jgi:uncharacterized membrane protein